jgi:hypothetical protein
LFGEGGHVEDDDGERVTGSVTLLIFYFQGREKLENNFFFCVVINFQYGRPISARVGDVSGIPPKKNVPSMLKAETRIVLQSRFGPIGKLCALLVHDMISSKMNPFPKCASSILWEIDENEGCTLLVLCG